MGKSILIFSDGTGPPRRTVDASLASQDASILRAGEDPRISWPEATLSKSERLDGRVRLVRFNGPLARCDGCVGWGQIRK
jgi:hypothetical protein